MRMIAQKMHIQSWEDMEILCLAKINLYKTMKFTAVFGILLEFRQIFRYDVVSAIVAIICRPACYSIF